MEIIINCEKRFDVWAIQRLGQTLNKTKQTYTKLRLELSEVRFLDNAALNYLKELAREFELEFVNMSPKAKLIFDLTGFELEDIPLAT